MPASRKSKDHSKNGGMRDPIQDDYKNFFMVDKDLKNLGMSDSDRFAVYTTISAVLHLGNIGKILAFFDHEIVSIVVIVLTFVSVMFLLFKR